MSNEKGGGGGTGPSGQPSALERYLAKQKEAKAKRGLDERPKSGASSLEERVAGVRSKFKQTSDPMSIPRPPEASTEPSSASQSVTDRTTDRAADRPQRVNEQPSSLSRWEKFGADEPDAFVKTNLGSTAQVGGESEEASEVDRERQAIPTRATPEIGTRLLAAIIDGIIVSCLSLPATKAASALLSIAFGPIVDRHGDGLDTVASFLVLYFYYSYFYSKKGASPGKLLFNIEIVDAETGRYLTPWKAFFREAIGKFISLVPFGMGYVIAAFRQDRRALHDLLFDTQVVMKKDSKL